MEAYKIGMSITLANSVSAALAMIAKDLLHVEGGVKKLQNELNGLNKTSLAVGGALGIMGGAAILGGMSKLVEHAKELRKIQEALTISGVHGDQLKLSTDKALESATKYGQKWEEILETMAEIRIPLGDMNGGMEKTREHIDQLAASMVVLKSVDKKGGSHIADQVYNLVKSAEFRNAVSPEQFDHAIDMMTRAAVVTQGRVNPAEFLKFSQYSRGALPGLSDRFLYTYGPELAQEFRGQGAGVVSSSLYQQIVGGMMSTTGLRQLQNLGMLNGGALEPVVNEQGKIKGYKNDFWNFDDKGRVVRAIKPGGIVGADVFASDPDKWAAILEEHYKTHGVTDDEAKRQYNAQIFRRGTTSQYINTLMFQRQRLDRGAGAIGEGWGVQSAAKELLDKDYETNIKRFHNAWSALLTALGDPLIDPAIKALKGMSEGIADLTKMARDNPEAVKIAGVIAVGLAGAMIVLGGAAVIAAAVMLAPNAAISVAVATVAVIIAKIAEMKWDAITAPMKELYNDLARLAGLAWSALTKGLGELVDIIMSIPDKLKSLFGSIKEWLGGAASKMGEAAQGGLWLQSYGGAAPGGGLLHRASYGGDAGAGLGSGSLVPPGASAPGGLFSAIRQHESGNNYGAITSQWHGARPNITGMTVDQAIAFARMMRSNGVSDSAMGAYQINGTTLEDFSRKMGLNGSELFDQAMQDRIATEIYRSTGGDPARLKGRWTSLRRYSDDAIRSMVAAGMSPGGSAGGKAGGIEIKPGADAYAYHPALMDLAKAAGVSRITALNDHYHKATRSMHARGLAMDMTGDPGKLIPQIRAQMRMAGLADGSDFKIIDEYSNPSSRATGGHVHVEFRSKDAADRFSKGRFANAVPPPGVMKGGGQGDVYLDGRKVGNVVENRMVRKHNIPQGPSSHDGSAAFTPPDLVEI